MENALDVEKGSRDMDKAERYFEGIMAFMAELRVTLLGLRDDIE